MKACCLVNMVGHDIDDDLDAVFGGGGAEIFQILLRTERRCLECQVIGTVEVMPR